MGEVWAKTESSEGWRQRDREHTGGLGSWKALGTQRDRGSGSGSIQGFLGSWKALGTQRDGGRGTGIRMRSLERSTKGWKQQVREYPGIFGVLESREEPEQQWGGSSLALGKHLVENRDEKGEGRGVW